MFKLPAHIMTHELKNLPATTVVYLGHMAQGAEFVRSSFVGSIEGALEFVEEREQEARGGRYSIGAALAG